MDKNLEQLLGEIEKGVIYRKEHYKNDAYFTLPDNISVDQIKFLQKEVTDKNGVGCRLYHRYKLQVYWDGTPIRNIAERVLDLPAIHDIDEQILVFEIFPKYSSG